ncbi:MAG: hypothetical protein ACYTAU_03425, partial [Planctomycetota bacterium]
VDELGGEKIDIVRWNESSQILIANALKPAEVEEVSLCFELGRATIIVREDQLSLAIGRRGQNVRLAARLTGWDIDILTPAEFAKSLEILEGTVKPLEGVTEEMLDRIGAMGMISVFDIEEVGPSVLQDELGMNEGLADHVVDVCAAEAKIVAEQQQKEKEEAERRKAEEEAAGAALLGQSTGGTYPSLDTAIDEESDLKAASILGDTDTPPAEDPPAEDSPAGTPSPAEAVEPSPDADEEVRPIAPSATEGGTSV